MYDVDFTLNEIEETKDLCYTMLNEMNKKLDNEYEKYIIIIHHIEEIIEEVCNDIVCAKAEKDLAEEVYDKNIKLKEKFNAEIEEIEKELVEQRKKTISLEKNIDLLVEEKNNICCPSLADADNDSKVYSALVSQYNNQRTLITNKICNQCDLLDALEKSIENKTKRIELLEKEIKKIDNANNQLLMLIKEIKQSIIYLEQYRDKCYNLKNRMENDFLYMYNKVKGASNHIEIKINIIKKIYISAECASDRVAKLLGTRIGRINLYSIYDLEVLNNDWYKMNRKLDESKNNLKSCTDVYIKNVKDNISKQIEKCIKEIDEDLKEIYSILNNKCNYSNEIKNYLEEYESWIKK